MDWEKISKDFSEINFDIVDVIKYMNLEMNVTISTFVNMLILELDIDSACIWNKNSILSFNLVKSLNFKNKVEE